MPKSVDHHWMTVALDLAEKGSANVSPNPAVGACVVRNNQIVGRGYHKYFGGPHAEVEALRDAGRKAKGATLYVTLEPCSSWGKTPPCAPEILKAGIKRVVIGALDENPDNRLRGVKAMKKGGIKVMTGVLASEVREQNAAFFKFIKTKMPYVTLKMAQSLDGKIATFQGKSRWITSASARQFVHKLRLEQDAILVGTNTLLKDNPMLSPRIRGSKRVREKPWRVILDPDLKASPHSRVFRGPQLTVVATSVRKVKSPGGKGKGQILLPVKEIRGRLDLKDLLKKLAGLDIAKILVEGGGETAWSFLKSGLVDKIYWIIAPTLIGGRNAKTSVEGEGIRDLDKVFRFRKTGMAMAGPDFVFEGSF